MTTKKVELMRVFNIQLASMFDDISIIFPENKEIKIAQTKYDALRKMNPSLIIKIWFTYIYTPYASIIDTGDMSLFYDKDYTEDLKNITKSMQTITESLYVTLEKNKRNSIKHRWMSLTDKGSTNAQH